jgi:hypothetical protein
MQQRTGRSSIAAATLAVFLILMLPGLAFAAQPSVSEAKIVVDYGVDGTDTVEATYTVGAVDGLKDGVLEHLWVRRPGTTVSDIEVTGDGQSSTVTEGKGITRVAVNLTANPATYTIRYKVKRESGFFVVPVFAPAIPVDRSESNVLIESILPAGQKLAGENFPALSAREERDGRTVLVHRVINVPSVVMAEYGTSKGISMSDVTTLLTVLLFLSVLVLWFRYLVRGTEVSHA